jgi:hypothetical protein
MLIPALVLNHLYPSWVTFALAIAAVVVNVVITILLVANAPSQEDWGELARRGNDDPDHLMTAYDVADVSGMPLGTVVEALRRDGMPRADVQGWRIWMPVAPHRIRYRRDDVTRWLER